MRLKKEKREIETEFICISSISSIFCDYILKTSYTLQQEVLNLGLRVLTKNTSFYFTLRQKFICIEYINNILASILSNHKLYVFLIAFGHISQVSFKTSITDSKYMTSNTVYHKQQC